MQDQSQALKYAERGAILSIIVYILLTCLKLIIGYLGHSDALIADGWNNFTDILSNTFILIGLRLARTPSDLEHQYGHWKIEHIASLLTSIVMFLISISVLINPIKRIITHQSETPDMLSGIVGLFCALLILFVYNYNYKLAKKVQSHALFAAAKDNLSDIYSSLGAGIAAICGRFGWHLFDNIVAIIIGLLILHSAISIFKQSAFVLSDGFDQTLIDEYTSCILKINGVDGIISIRGRSYGSLIYLDIDLYMNPQMTVKQSHDLTELIEERLYNEYDVAHAEIHVEPTPRKEHNYGN